MTIQDEPSAERHEAPRGRISVAKRGTQTLDQAISLMGGMRATGHYLIGLNRIYDLMIETRARLNPKPKSEEASDDAR